MRKRGMGASRAGGKQGGTGRKAKTRGKRGEGKKEKENPADIRDRGQNTGGEAWKEEGRRERRKADEKEKRR
jgi:hypothetical protein